MKKFFSEIFQDIDGAFSSKRIAFFIFIVLFIILTTGIFFHVANKEVLDYFQSALDKVTDIIKWLGGFIVAERTQVFSPNKDKSNV